MHKQDPEPIAEATHARVYQASNPDTINDVISNF